MKGDVVAEAVLLFAVCSLAGWAYETIENVFSFGGLYLRAALLLPWCPIYGIRGVVLVYLLRPAMGWLRGRVPLPAEILLMALATYAVTTAVELAGSYVCETLTGTMPWDYSHAAFNFDGRIAPEYTLRFALLGLMALYIVHPALERWVVTHGRTARALAVAVAALLAVDTAVESAGVWGAAEDALAPLGVRHW